MMWPGAEPERGKYNESYFSASKILVNRYSGFSNLCNKQIKKLRKP